MVSIKFKEKLKLIFLPVVGLSILLFLASALLSQARTSVILSQLDRSYFPMLNQMAVLPQIILVVALFILAKRGSFEKLVKYTLLSLIGIVSLLTLLMFFQGIEAPPSMIRTPTNTPSYMSLFSKRAVSLFYITSSLLNFKFFFILIWGFVNRLTNVSEGMKYYVPLAFILGLVSAPGDAALLWMGSLQWPLIALIVPAIALMACALLMFNWAWKKLPKALLFPKESATDSHTGFPWLSGAYLLAGCLMATNLFGVLFKNQLFKQYPSPNAYSAALGSYLLTSGLSTIFMMILWLGAGTWLLQKKGWRTTVTYGSISVLVGTLLFFGCNALSESAPWLYQGIYKALLMGTQSILFFPLIQILYLCLPSQLRFRAKVTTEMIAEPLLVRFSSLATQGLIMVFGSVNAIALYLNILTVIIVVLLVIVSRVLSSSFANRAL